MDGFSKYMSHFFPEMQTKILQTNDKWIVKDSNFLLGDVLFLTAKFLTHTWLTELMEILNIPHRVTQQQDSAFSD